VLVVLADVTHELAREVVDRTEDPPGDHIAFDLGESEFDLIKPRGQGRSEMQVQLGILGVTVDRRRIGSGNRMRVRETPATNAR